MITVFLKGFRSPTNEFSSERFYLHSSSGGTLLVRRRTDQKIVAAYAAGEWRRATDTPTQGA